MKVLKEEYNLNEFQLSLLNILKVKPMTRRELVSKLEMPRTTIFDNLKKLKNKGLVKDRQLDANGRGRPKVQWYC